MVNDVMLTRSSSGVGDVVVAESSDVVEAEIVTSHNRG